MIEGFIREEPACMNTLKEGHVHIRPEWRGGRASQPGLKNLRFLPFSPASGLTQFGWASQFLNQEILKAGPWRQAVWRGVWHQSLKAKYCPLWPSVRSQKRVFRASQDWNKSALTLQQFFPKSNLKPSCHFSSKHSLDSHTRPCDESLLGQPTGQVLVWSLE